MRAGRAVSDLATVLLAELDDDALDALAERLAPRLAGRLAPAEDRWLTAADAGHYLGVTRKRIYDLASMRAIEPDGRDGRTPLYRRETLDAYARGRST